MASNASGARRVVEQEAGSLVVYQLDLLAQLEHQLRAVHQSMRRIETLRAKDRPGAGLYETGKKSTRLIG